MRTLLSSRMSGSSRRCRRIVGTASALCGLWLASLLPLSSVAAQDAIAFQRGDSNGDELFDLSDAVFLVESLFVTNRSFDCMDAADIDDDGRVNVTDAIHAATFLFLGGEAPAAPFRECGLDPTEDDLDCEFYPGCDDGGTVTCLSEELVSDLLAGIDVGGLGFSFCLPAGVLQFELDAFAVSVCPEDSADPCGGTDTPGCPVDISGLEPVVDLENGRLGLAVSGHIEDLPIDVTESFLGTTTTCLNTIGAEGETSEPFRLEIILSLLLEETEPGVRSVVGLGESSVENVDLELESSGGLVCVLFSAGQEAFIGLIVAPLEEALQGFAETIEEQVVGLRICDEL